MLPVSPASPKRWTLVVRWSGVRTGHRRRDNIHVHLVFGIKITDFFGKCAAERLRFAAFFTLIVRHLVPDRHQEFTAIALVCLCIFRPVDGRREFLPIAVDFDRALLDAGWIEWSDQFSDRS